MQEVYNLGVVENALIDRLAYRPGNICFLALLPEAGIILAELQSRLGYPDVDQNNLFYSSEEQIIPSQMGNKPVRFISDEPRPDILVKLFQMKVSGVEFILVNPSKP